MNANGRKLKINAITDVTIQDSNKRSTNSKVKRKIAHQITNCAGRRAGLISFVFPATDFVARFIDR